MQTIKDIQLNFEAFCNSHPQLNTFGFDHIDNLSTKDRVFPVMWVMPMDSPLNKLTYDVYFGDVLLHDRSNFIDILTDMNAVGYDFVKHLETSTELDFDTANISPFESKFDDHTAGMKFTVTIDIINAFNC